MSLKAKKRRIDQSKSQLEFVDLHIFSGRRRHTTARMHPMTFSSTLKRTALTVTLACGALGFSTAAFALASSSASLTNFRITLSDLDSIDGVTPSITFASGVLSYADARVEQYSDYTGQYASQFGKGAFAPASASVSLPRAQASARVSGDSTWPGLATSAQGSAIGGPASEESNYSALGNAPNNYVSFTLTANSAVTFAAYATTTASVTVGAG